MTRLNLILFAILILTALGTISAQDKSRKLYIELQQHEDAAKQYDVEWGQLQLEQSTWAMHARIEDIATQQLHMQVPDAKRVQVLVQNVSQIQKAVDVKPASNAEVKP
jgi:cell division protein FtsL